MTENLLKKTKKRKGFTLIELIVVIAIIAIISLIAIPRVLGYQDSAKKKADIANAKTIATTTATLMANEKLTGLDANKDEVITIVDSGAEDDALLIKQALQSVPTPQASGTNFVVRIDDGVITVDNGTVENKLYPTHEGIYAGN